jgi:hypothetical protein
MWQQLVNLHECTGALPSIGKDDIKAALDLLQQRQPPTTATRNNDHDESSTDKEYYTTMNATIPYFVTDNTTSAMISMTLRSYLLALHHTIKQWVYTIWDDVMPTTNPTTTERYIYVNNHSQTSIGTLAENIVACCITGTECDLILQLLQYTPQHLLEHFCFVTDTDLSWISPSPHINKIHLSAWSNVPSYIYHSIVMGPPEQFITVRRRKYDHNDCDTSSTTKGENGTKGNDGTMRQEEMKTNHSTFPNVSDDDIGGKSTDTRNNNESSVPYEYISVALYKQKHIRHYGLQQLLFRYSQIRNKPLLQHDDNHNKHDGNTDPVGGGLATSSPSSPSIAYVRQQLYGCRIAKYFGNVIYIGYVTYVEGPDIDSTTTTTTTTANIENMSSDIFTIQYDDGDEEEMNVHELYGALFLLLGMFDCRFCPTMLFFLTHLPLLFSM